MTKYVAILIDGDNENTLGYACSRDLWNISKKLINDIHIDVNNIFAFLHNITNDVYIKQIAKLGITNFYHNSLENVGKCFEHIISLSEKEHISIYFHYSGHGYQIHDTNGDEIDGLDEIFLGHSMTDDYIWNNLITKLSVHTHIFISIDACHSGSGADIPYIWKNNMWTLAKNKNIESNCSGFSVSACNDSQCAQQDIGDTTGFAGSLTACLCDLCDFKELIYNPLKYNDVLTNRLNKLHQTFELYSIQK
jgi:hypothetical protein